MMNHGTITFIPQHMDSILVEAWYSFNVSPRNIIGYIFFKTNLLPLSHTNFSINIQVFVSFIRIYDGPKLKTSMKYHNSPSYLSKYRTSVPTTSCLYYNKSGFNNHPGMLSFEMQCMILWVNKLSFLCNKWRNKIWKYGIKIRWYCQIVKNTSPPGITLVWS